MNTEAFKLARATLRLAVKEYGFMRLANGGGRMRYKALPGRFEGEHWSIVHWYDAYMNGCSDESGAAWDAFETTATERAAFSMEDSEEYVVLEHSEQGFVSMHTATREQIDSWLEEESDDETDML